MAALMVRRFETWIRKSPAMIAVAIALFALGACTIVYLLPPVADMFQLKSENYNEGWNAFHTARLLSGDPLYPSIETLIQNNYPPLSFYIVGGVTILTGDALIAGRIVALVSLLSVSVAMGLTTLNVTNSRSTAILAGITILAVLAGNYPIYVAYDDPQLLGHAFMAVGLYCLSMPNPGRSRIVAASIFMLMGGFTKHLLIALPIATSIWFLLRSKREFLTWVFFSAVFAMFGMMLCFALFGGEFFSSVLGHEREVSAGLFLLGLTGLFVLAPIIVIGVSSLAHLEGLRGPSGLLAIATALSVLTALLAKSGKGVDANAYFDIVIYGVASAASFIVFVSRRLQDAHLRRVIPALLWVLVLTPAISPISYRLPGALNWRAEREQRINAANAVTMSIKALDTSVACQRLSFCYWAGKPFVMDFFNVSSAAAASPAFRAQIRQRIRSGEISAFQLDRNWRRKLEQFADVIDEHYVLIGEEGIYGGVYVRRAEQDAE